MFGWGRGTTPLPQFLCVCGVVHIAFGCPQIALLGCCGARLSESSRSGGMVPHETRSAGCTRRR
jgi:hypothetical protein